MLEKKTVLILGAGASQPYGYPTGIELSHTLSRELIPGGNGHSRLKALGGYSREHIVEFREAFKFSGKNSVDAFLEHRTEYMEIGKAAMAAILVPQENPETLFDYQNSWLRCLYNNMNTSFEEFGKQPLSIITFNYDRTVEHFLFSSLKHSYGKSDEECRDALNAIPIIHLHGRLAYLPWQNPDEGRPYDFNLDERAIELGTKNIKIIHEDITGRDEDFSKAKALLAEAQQTFFLGFGYARMNLQRIGIDRDLGGPVYGTAQGLGQEDMKRVSAFSNNKITFINAGLTDVVNDRIDWGSI